MASPATPAPPNPVRIFVDPTCPYAWITSRWLIGLAEAGRIDLEIGLISLPVINEGRELDPDYRARVDRAWFPSRVALAVLTAHGAAGLRAFYDAFGRRLHVESAPLSRETIEEALAEADLETSLADAGDDPARDDRLRELTAEALASVDNPDVGTPIVHLAGRGFFGPVLTWIPRGEEAVRLFEALLTLAEHPAFVELKRGRPDAPVTA